MDELDDTLLKAFRSLDEKDQYRILGIIEGILMEKEKRKEQEEKPAETE